MLGKQLAQLCQTVLSSECVHVELDKFSSRNSPRREFARFELFEKANKLTS